MSVFNPNKSTPYPAQDLVWQTRKMSPECGFQGHTLPSQSSTSLPGLLSQCLCLSLLSVQVLPLLEGWHNSEPPSASLEIKLGPLLSTPYLLGETGLDS